MCQYWRGCRSNSILLAHCNQLCPAGWRQNCSLGCTAYEESHCKIGRPLQCLGDSLLARCPTRNEILPKVGSPRDDHIFTTRPDSQHPWAKSQTSLDLGIATTTCTLAFPFAQRSPIYLISWSDCIVALCAIRTISGLCILTIHILSLREPAFNVAIWVVLGSDLHPHQAHREVNL